MTIEIKRQALDGAVTWTNVASGVTAYRTDLARGITAAQVPYSGVTVTSTFDEALSAVPTTFVALTAVTTAE